MTLSPPGNLGPPSESWTKKVSNLIQIAVHGDGRDFPGALAGAEPAGQPPPFFDPAEETLGTRDARVPPWRALSGTLAAVGLSGPELWKLADNARLEPFDDAKRAFFGQDEYCEWSVERDPETDEVWCVTFTTELEAWFEHLASEDRDECVRSYRERAGEEVPESEIVTDDDEYIGGSASVNRRVDGPIVHLAQQNNNLWAAISLAAEASILRRGPSGAIVHDPQALMTCGGLGEKTRFSDPTIAATVNALAASGARISLADPPGLYLAGIRTTGMALPDDNLRPQDLWHEEQGSDDRVVRARFEAPDRAFPLSKVLLDGNPIVSGAQLADRVDVFLVASVNDAGAEPMVKTCKTQS